MPRTIPHRELRNQSSHILRAVQDGASYIVTNHDEEVALLSPMPPAPGDALRVRRATVRGGFGDLVQVRRDEPTSDALDDLRGES